MGLPPLPTLSNYYLWGYLPGERQCEPLQSISHPQRPPAPSTQTSHTPSPAVMVARFRTWDISSTGGPATISMGKVHFFPFAYGFPTISPHTGGTVLNINLLSFLIWRSELPKSWKIKGQGLHIKAEFPLSIPTGCVQTK